VFWSPLSRREKCERVRLASLIYLSRLVFSTVRVRLVFHGLEYAGPRRRNGMRPVRREVSRMSFLHEKKEGIRGGPAVVILCSRRAMPRRCGCRNRTVACIIWGVRCRRRAVL